MIYLYGDEVSMRAKDHELMIGLYMSMSILGRSYRLKRCGHFCNYHVDVCCGCRVKRKTYETLQFCFQCASR